MKYLGIGLVRLYRITLGQFVGGRCKYYPSCSQYAIDAYQEYGFFRGTAMSAWRLLRCNPWSHGGVDYAAPRPADPPESEHPEESAA